MEGYVPVGAGSPGRKGPAVRAKAGRASAREGATRVHRVRSLRPRNRRRENSSQMGAPAWPLRRNTSFHDPGGLQGATLRPSVCARARH